MSTARIAPRFSLRLPPWWPGQRLRARLELAEASGTYYRGEYEKTMVVVRQIARWSQADQGEASHA